MIQKTTPPPTATQPLVSEHAYLLRTLADKARAWDDLCLAASLLELPA